MKTSTRSQPIDHQGLHFLSRGIGVLALVTILLYLRAILVGGFLEVSMNSELNTTVLIALLVMGAISLLIGWRWPRVGGLMAVLFSIPVAWFVGMALEVGNLFAAFIYSSPLLIAGILYILDSRAQIKPGNP